LLATVVLTVTGRGGNSDVQGGTVPHKRLKIGTQKIQMEKQHQSVAQTPQKAPESSNMLFGRRTVTSVLCVRCHMGRNRRIRVLVERHTKTITKKQVQLI
jgi:hypothetical protein